MMSSFGAQIIGLMSALGVSQSELARRLGVTQAAVCQYVHGRPTEDTVRKLARALGRGVRLEFYGLEDDEDDSL